MSDAQDEFACVDETHYIHLGVNPKTGLPCNSSVGPASWSAILPGEEEKGWRCVGCGQWWYRMPVLEPLGLVAITKMRK